MKDKTIALVAFLGLFLVLSNFVLDTIRSQVEDPKERLKAEIRDIDDRIALAHAMANEVAGQHQAVVNRVETLDYILRESNDALTQLIGFAGKLSARAALLEEEEAAMDAPPPGDTEEAEDDLDRRLTLDEIFDVPLEVIREKLDNVRDEDPRLLKVATGLGEPAKWDAESIVDQVAALEGRELSADERRLLALKVGVYKQAYRSLRTRYLFELKRGAIQRTLDGDHLESDENGRYAVWENYEKEEVLAVTMGERGLFVWDKDSYPELNRLNASIYYLPMVMLHDLSELVHNPGQYPGQTNQGGSR